MSNTLPVRSRVSATAIISSAPVPIGAPKSYSASAATGLAFGAGLAPTASSKENSLGAVGLAAGATASSNENSLAIPPL